jgi:hypothetical protein
MAAPNLAAPLIAALEAEGAQLLAAHKAAIEAYVEPLADSDANAVIGAITAHIQMSGLASIAQTPLRNALTGAEPQVDAIINANLGGGFDALEALLTNLAKAATATG